MSDVETPIIPELTPKIESQAPSTPVPEAVQKPQPGPAEDVRVVQQLLANALLPGNVAPAVVKAYNYLEALAQKIEKDSGESK